jgi:hypothetical protein
MRRQTILFLVVSLCSASFVAGRTATDKVRITDLFTSSEKQNSGLSKLSDSELDALNAAVFRVMVQVESNDAKKTGSPEDGSTITDDLDFYDSGGHAVAYAAADHDLTIYLWSGKPVAYLDDKNVYGFNGKHLGWYEEGVVYDHQGHMIAALASRFTNAVSTPPFKSFKQFEPFKAFEQFAPFEPFLTRNWSDTSALQFFLQGAK